MREVVRVGVIGGGLMGKEVASAFGRWFVLNDVPVDPALVAVADLDPDVLGWFRRVPTVSLLTTDYRELLAHPTISVVYAAVPHHLHEQVYLDVLAAGKDLLAEKPFGIDLGATERIAAACVASGRFVRCSSEFPFYPGAVRVSNLFGETKGPADHPFFGELMEVNAAFWHSSDMDLQKPINWKRQVRFCGEAGVMNDLGLHVAHLPLRFGLAPSIVYAQLQNIATIRPDGKGGTAVCDTWDNATLSTTLSNGAPMRLETKRMARGETNTWQIEILGTRGAIRYSTKHSKSLYVSNAHGRWEASDLGHASVFPVVTGGIFEFGFPDALLQMWAAYLTERHGSLGQRFGCATPEEAVTSHRIWDAALRSHASGCSEGLKPASGAS